MKNYIHILLATLSSLTIIGGCKKDRLPDSGGNILDRIVGKSPSTGEIVSITQFTYTPNGSILRINAQNTQTGSTSDQHFEYDLQGRLIKTTMENSEAGTIGFYTYQYDAGNRIVKAVGNPLLPSLTLNDFSYSYDQENRIIADSIYQTGSGLTDYYVYTYDNSNNVVFYQHFVRSGATSFVSSEQVSITYDKNPNPYKMKGDPMYFAGAQNGYSYLSAANHISITPANGSVTPVYSYYRNGLLKGISYGTIQSLTTKEFFYKY